MTNLAFHSMALREYYARKHGWLTKTIDSIWWATYYKPLSLLTDPEKLCINKFVNNRWATQPQATVVNVNYMWKMKNMS
jgi:hypothetical protein